MLDPDRTLASDFLSQVDVEIYEPGGPDAATSIAAVKVLPALPLGGGRWRQKGYVHVTR